MEYDAPRQLAPGVWLTGPVPRLHAERNWSGRGRLRTPEGLVEDTIPEDQSLVVDTDAAWSCCRDAATPVSSTRSRSRARRCAPRPMHALVGGFHLFAADDATLRWTAGGSARPGSRT